MSPLFFRPRPLKAAVTFAQILGGGAIGSRLMHGAGTSASSTVSTNTTTHASISAGAWRLLWPGTYRVEACSGGGGGGGGDEFYSWDGWGGDAGPYADALMVLRASFSVSVGKGGPGGGARSRGGGGNNTTLGPGFGGSGGVGGTTFPGASAAQKAGAPGAQFSDGVRRGGGGDGGTGGLGEANAGRPGISGHLRFKLVG